MKAEYRFRTLYFIIISPYLSVVKGLKTSSSFEWISVNKGDDVRFTCSVLEEDAEPQLRTDSTADAFPATGITPASSGDLGEMMRVINFRAHRRASLCLFFLFYLHVLIVLLRVGWILVLFFMNCCITSFTFYLLCNSLMFIIIHCGLFL